MKASLGRSVNASPQRGQTIRCPAVRPASVSIAALQYGQVRVCVAMPLLSMAQRNLSSPGLHDSCAASSLTALMNTSGRSLLSSASWAFLVDKVPMPRTIQTSHARVDSALSCGDAGG